MMSELGRSRSSDMVQLDLERCLEEMMQHERKGAYAEAETCKIKSEALRKEFQARKLVQMEQKQKRDLDQLNKMHSDQLNYFNSFWDKKMDDLIAEAAQQQKDLNTKHLNDLTTTREDLEKQLTVKTKESSECLNLRKMEEYMVKQKNYAQAHKVQQRLAELEGEEKNAWMSAREVKIQTALNTLKAKQAAEMAALQKRCRTTADEQNKDRKIEESRLLQKFNNVVKELRSQHQKDLLAFKGQFKSKGGSGSPQVTSKKKVGA